MPSDDWISELDKHGFNILIDELVYHLESARTLKAIEKIDESGTKSGYKFVFADSPDSFLPVDTSILSKDWTEAKAIARTFPELSKMRFVDN